MHATSKINLYHILNKNHNVKFIKISTNNKNIINIKLYFDFKAFYKEIIFIQKLFFV